MDSDELRSLLKRSLVIAAFFAPGLLFFVIGRTNYALGRGLLVAYVIIVAIVMVLAILLQAGRGGGLASLGGVGGDSLLGARSATPIAKATFVLGALFLFLCMLTARLGAFAPVPGPETLKTQRPAMEQPAGMAGTTPDEQPAGPVEGE